MGNKGLDKFLKNMNPKTMKLGKTNLTYEQVLMNEAKRFKNLILKYLNEARANYIPSEYIRDNSILGSFDIDDTITLNIIGNKFEIGVKINDSTWHNSVIDSSVGNAVALSNWGWQVRSEVPFSRVEHFGYFSGYHFIENAVDEFESTSKFGVKVKVNKPNEFYKY